MTLDLGDEETAALVRLLTDTIDGDRYPLSPRDSDLEEHSLEDQAGAGPRTVATAQGVCTTASNGCQKAPPG
jgi:hypothetical protein